MSGILANHGNYLMARMQFPERKKTLYISRSISNHNRKMRERKPLPASVTAPPWINKTQTSSKRRSGSRKQTKKSRPHQPKPKSLPPSPKSNPNHQRDKQESSSIQRWSLPPRLQPETPWSCRRSSSWARAAPARSPTRGASSGRPHRRAPPAPSPSPSRRTETPTTGARYGSFSPSQALTKPTLEQKTNPLSYIPFRFTLFSFVAFKIVLVEYWIIYMIEKKLSTCSRKMNLPWALNRDRVMQIKSRSLSNRSQ